MSTISALRKCINAQLHSSETLALNLKYSLAISNYMRLDNKEPLNFSVFIAMYQEASEPVRHLITQCYEREAAAHKSKQLFLNQLGNVIAERSLEVAGALQEKITLLRKLYVNLQNPEMNNWNAYVAIHTADEHLYMSIVAALCLVQKRNLSTDDIAVQTELSLSPPLNDNQKKAIKTLIRFYQQGNIEIHQNQTTFNEMIVSPPKIYG